jgi:hypothetical protein
MFTSFIVSIGISITIGVATNLISGLIEPNLKGRQKLLYSFIIALIALTLILYISFNPGNTSSETTLNQIINIKDINSLSRIIQQEWTHIDLDDFSKNTLDTWTSSDSTSAIVETLIDKGAYKIKVSANDWAYQKPFIRNYFTAPDDFELSVDAAMSAGFGCGYGLVVKADLSGNYYMFGLLSKTTYENDVRYVITKVTPSLSQKRKVLITGDLPNNIGFPNSLKVISINNKLFFFVNERFINAINLEEDKIAIKGSGVGLEVLTCPNYTFTYTFKNFKLTIPKTSDKRIQYIGQTNIEPNEYPNMPIVEITSTPPKWDLVLDPINSELSTNQNNSTSLINQIENFRISTRFFNPDPTETESWSYGFYFWQNDQGSAYAYVRSDSVWEVAYYDYTSRKHISFSFGVLKDLALSEASSNELELSVFGNRVIFKVNNLVIYDHRLNSAYQSGNVNATIGIDDEKNGDYKVRIEKLMLWDVK